jgi:hypothetical protein
MLRKNLVDRPIERGWASAGDLRRMFGHDNQFWVSACDAGFLRGAVRGMLSGLPIWQVPLEAVQEIALYFKQTLSPEEAAARLRLAPYQLGPLERLGMLKKFSCGVGSRLRRFLIPEVDGVIRSLVAVAEPRFDLLEETPVTPLSYVSLTERERRKAPLWEHRMVRILAGRIPLIQTNRLCELGFSAFATPRSRCERLRVPPLTAYSPQTGRPQ